MSGTPAVTHEKSRLEYTPCLGISMPAFGEIWLGLIHGDSHSVDSHETLKSILKDNDKVYFHLERLLDLKNKGKWR